MQMSSPTFFKADIKQLKQYMYNACVMLLWVYIHTAGKLEKYAWPRWESNLYHITEISHTRTDLTA
jgi:hypothetical protein